MFCKLFVLAALLAVAVAAPKPGFLTAAPIATTYTAPLTYGSPLAYSAGYGYAPSFGFDYGVGFGGLRTYGFGRSLFF